MNNFWLNLIVYLSLLFCIVVCTSKIVKYSRMPMHLRWELYPGPREAKRAKTGSYFEELNWWTKPRSKSNLEEFKFIGREILKFQLYYRTNRSYWYKVYPFHLGVYLLVVWIALLVLSAVFPILGLPVSISSGTIWGSFVYYLTIITGGTGLILAVYGSISLIIKRATDEDLRAYTARIDYINLSFILIILFCYLCGWLIFDSEFSHLRNIVTGIISVKFDYNINAFYGLAIVLNCMFLIYMPFTRMMHYMAKYFTYHKVRWDDEPSIKGGKLEKKVIRLLNRYVSWSAHHIATGKSWASQVEDLGIIKRKS
jgi:nitrate reductase gamma subunit